MRFYGFYNFKGGGTEQITGITNEGLPSSTDNISNNPSIFFSGQFSNLSRRLVHVGLHAFRHDGSTTLHKHDIRAYESLNLSNIIFFSLCSLAQKAHETNASIPSAQNRKKARM